MTTLVGLDGFFFFSTYYSILLFLKVILIILPIILFIAPIFLIKIYQVNQTGLEEAIKYHDERSLYSNMELCQQSFGRR